MTERKRLIKALDSAVSDWARGFGCESCGRYMLTEPHHISSRRNIRTRWERENIVKVCRTCHSMIQNDKAMENRLFGERCERMRQLGNETWKPSTDELRAKLEEVRSWE